MHKKESYLKRIFSNIKNKFSKNKYKVGNTPLIKDTKLSKKYGFEIFIKDESKNPSGTFKDRRSEFIIKHAIEEHADTIVLITSGNAGYSLGLLSKGINIRIVFIIDKNIKTSIKNKLEKYGEIKELDLSKKILNPEEIISIARKKDTEFILDATNGFHKAYESIIKEIKDERPNVIVVPIGSGELFVGLYDAIKKIKLKTKLIGVTVKDKWHSFADKLHTPYTPYKNKMKRIIQEGHKIIKIDEEEIKKAYNQYKDIYNIEPSSSVVFAVLPKLKLRKKSKVILINTGKGLL